MEGTSVIFANRGRDDDFRSWAGEWGREGRWLEMIFSTEVTTLIYLCMHSSRLPYATSLS